MSVKYREWAFICEARRVRAALEGRLGGGKGRAGGGDGVGGGDQGIGGLLSTRHVT